MRLISSRMTFFYKRVFPILWFGFIGLFLLMAIYLGGPTGDPLFFGVPVFLAVLGFFLFRKLIWDLADEVLDGGDHLLIKQRGYEERVPFSTIMNVSASTAVSPPRISLRLVEPGRLGSEVVFSPPASLTINPFAKSQLAEELMVRAHRARTKSEP